MTQSELNNHLKTTTNLNNNQQFPQKNHHNIVCKEFKWGGNGSSKRNDKNTANLSAICSVFFSLISITHFISFIFFILRRLYVLYGKKDERVGF